MSEPDLSKFHFLPHPKAERIDTVTVETVPRWKESELSGDEYRFSYVATGWSHGQKVGSVNGRSVADALLQSAARLPGVEKPEGWRGGYYGDLEHVCCQPACTEPWVVLLHPIKRYDAQGGELVRPRGDHDVRGFCERHRRRGDCGLDDADDNYTLVYDRRAAS